MMSDELRESQIDTEWQDVDPTTTLSGVMTVMTPYILSCINGGDARPATA